MEERNNLSFNEKTDDVVTEEKTYATPEVNADIIEKPNFGSNAVVTPEPRVMEEGQELPNVVRKETEKSGQITARPSIIELANNPDFTIATISKEANRIKERDEGEVFISLH